MSTTTISRSHRIQLTIAATALVLALIGGIGSAFAQAAGGGGKGGGGAPGGGAPGAGGGASSATILYGTPGNCPPTIACGSPKPPVVHKAKRIYLCGDHRSFPGGRFVCRPDEI